MTATAVEADQDDSALAAAWFVRLWGIAVIAHIVGNPRLGQLWPDLTALGLLTFLLGMAAVALVARPGDLALVATASLTVAVAVAEAPFIGNHWLLAALVSVALLISVFKRDSWGWFSLTARWILLGFYAWAAFNKLTEGFFDATASCGLFYANQWLDSYRLPTIAAGGAAATGVAVITAAVELSVPILLVWRRTRRAGVLLAMTFHFVISLDLGQHFYDFTAVLFPLFSLFLGDRVLAALEERRPRLTWARFALPAVLGLFVLASVVPLTPVTDALLGYGVFILWIPFGIWLIWTTARISHGQPEVAMRPRGVLMPLLVVIVVANGALPYLEVKTGYSWNMYANLVTADGESNHLVIRRTFPLTDEQVDPVVVLATDDPGLAAYVDSGYALTWNRFRHYLASHPDAEVTYERAGFERTVTGAEVGQTLPWWRDRFQLFRAIDLERPVRCQAYWLPAR